MEQDAKQQTLVDVPEGWKAGEFVIMAGRSGTIKEIKGQRVCVKHHDDGGYERWYDLSDLPEKTPGADAGDLSWQAENEIDRLQKQIDDLQEDQDAARQQNQALFDQMKDLKRKADEAEALKQERARLLAEVDRLQREMVAVEQNNDAGDVEHWEIRTVVHQVHEVQEHTFENAQGWELLDVTVTTVWPDDMARPYHYRHVTLRRRVSGEPDDRAKVVAAEPSVDVEDVTQPIPVAEDVPAETEPQTEPVAEAVSGTVIFPHERGPARSLFEKALRDPGLSAAQIGAIGDQEIIQMVLGRREQAVPRALEMLGEGVS
jgi:hypothetical protein